jgi:hypothetical protein
LHGVDNEKGRPTASWLHFCFQPSSVVTNRSFKSISALIINLAINFSKSLHLISTPLLFRLNITQTRTNNRKPPPQQRQILKSTTMSYQLILALLMSLNLAAAQFTLTASLPGTSFDGEVINAAGQAFYLGLDGPASFCPLSNQTLCPAGNETVFVGMIGLFVHLPSRTIWERADEMNRSKFLAASRSMSRAEAHLVSRLLIRLLRLLGLILGGSRT